MPVSVVTSICGYSVRIRRPAASYSLRTVRDSSPGGVGGVGDSCALGASGVMYSVALDLRAGSVVRERAQHVVAVDLGDLQVVAVVVASWS